MSDTTDTLIANAKLAASDQVVQIIGSAKSTFLGLFGDFISAADITRIEGLFTKAAIAKAAQFAANTPGAAQEAADEYDTYMDTIETIGDEYLILGKAKAGVLVRSVVHEIISGFFAVAGGVLQAGLGIVLPGVGSLIGAGANAGLQHVVSYFLGTDHERRNHRSARVAGPQDVEDREGSRCDGDCSHYNLHPASVLWAAGSDVRCLEGLDRPPGSNDHRLSVPSGSSRH